MAPRLLDMPPEVLHLILYHSAWCRRLKRALRLRLVCKAFAVLVYPALFEIDELLGGGPPESIGTMDCQLLLQHGGEQMWHEYMVRRVMRARSDRDRDRNRYLELRQVALAVHGAMQPGGDAPIPELREVVETLCWLLLRQEVKGTGCERRPLLWKLWGPSAPPRAGVTTAEASRFSLSLLSAAAYLNLPALAQGLLDDGHNPHHHSLLFAPAMQLAAQAGHRDMLALLRRPGHARDAGTENWALVGAAIRGDMETLDFVLEGESLPVMAPSTHWARYYGSAYDVGERCHARSRAIYRRISEAFCPRAALEPYPWELAHYARLGNLDMVEYLVDYGLPLQPANRETPLVAACRGGHYPVVQFLLARGADPNHAAERLDYALHLPTTAGSPALTQLLLDHGATTRWAASRLPKYCDDDGRYPALWWAFARESPAVVRLLVVHSATIPRNGEIMDSIADMLHYLGYDSMKELLRQLFGVQPLPMTYLPTLSVHRNGWQAWPEVEFLERRAMARGGQLRMSRLRAERSQGIKFKPVLMSEVFW